MFTMSRQLLNSVGIDLVGHVSKILSIGAESGERHKRLNESNNGKKKKKNITVPLCERSASTFLRDNYDCLDPYPLPFAFSSFIPNDRLRHFQKSVLRALNDSKNVAVPGDLQELFHHMYTHTFAVAKAKENSSRLIARAILRSVIRRVPPEFRPRERAEEESQIRMNFALSSARSKPEIILLLQEHAVLAVEAKCAKSSTLLCLPQGCSLAGDIALTLLDLHVQLDRCAVPLLLCAGTSVQIAGAYLIKECFPVFCMISRQFDVLEMQDLHELTVWVEHLAKFVIETARSIPVKFPAAPHCTGTLGNRKLVELKTTYFFKPLRGDSHCETSGCRISTHRAIGITMMEVYRRLWEADENARQFILFPIGWVQLPELGKSIHEDLAGVITVNRTGDKDALTPVVVYDYLAEPWSNAIPPRDKHDQFLEQLRKAIELCNTAKVVLLDLRPSNIMWKYNDDRKTVDMRFIDFEDAYPEGWLIRPKFIQYQLNEKYLQLLATYHEVDDQYFAITKTNKWFYTTIQEFFSCPQFSTDHGAFKDFLLSKMKSEKNAQTPGVSAPAPSSVDGAEAIAATSSSVLNS